MDTGRFAPVDPVTHIKRTYRGETMVLETLLETATGRSS